MPDRPQSLVAREIRWALRWVFLGWGLPVLLLFLGLWAAEIVLTVHGVRTQGGSQLHYEGPILLLTLARLVVFAVLWFFLLSRRTLRPFGRERIADLLVTPLAGRDLWPALLAGPALVLIVLSVATEAMYVLLPLSLGDPYYLLHAYLRASETMSADELMWVRRIRWIDVPVTIVTDAIFYSASIAMGAALSLPGGRALRRGFAFFVMLLMVVPQVVLEFWSDHRAVLSGTVAERDQLIMDFVVGPAMTALIALLVFALSFAWLRSARFSARLHVWSED